MAIDYTCLIGHNSITPTEWTPQRSNFYNRYIGIAVSIFFFVIGTPSNGFVIISIFRKQRYTEPAMMTLLCLATADLLICSLILPITTITGIADDFILGGSDYVRCRFCRMGIFLHILTFALLSTVAFMSVERFVYIWRPLQYERCRIVKIVRFLMVAVWLLSIVLSLTPMFGFGTIFFGEFLMTCSISFSMSADGIRYLLLLGVVPVIPLIVTNVCVFCMALKSMRMHYRMMNQHKYVDNLLQKVGEDENKGQLRVIKVFIVILVANTVTLIPVLGLMIAGQTFVTNTYNSDFTLLITPFTYLALLSQSAVHPIIEYCSLLSIKEKMSKALERICGEDCCHDDNIGNQCCGEHCIFLNIGSGAGLPKEHEESDISPSCVTK